MATFNFKTTEDDRPGGGVYKIPGNGPTWNIKQSDYPRVNMSGLTASNFFAATSCNGAKASVYTSSGWCNIGGRYTGGNKGTISVSHTSSGVTVTIVGAVNRSAYCYKESGETGSATKAGTFNYTLYMCRTQIT